MRNENHHLSSSRTAEDTDLRNLFSQFAQNSPKCKYILFEEVLKIEEKAFPKKSGTYSELIKVLAAARGSIENTGITKQLLAFSKYASSWKIKSYTFNFTAHAKN